MSFRIRQNFERAFAKPVQEVKTEIDENQSVFVVDEETGEIKEEKNNVVSTTQSVPVQAKNTAFTGLSMSKNTKASFM